MTSERQRRANRAQIRADLWRDRADLWRDTANLWRQVQQLTQRMDEFVNRQPRDRCARRKLSEPQYQFFEEFSDSSTKVIVSNISYDVKDLFKFGHVDEDYKSINWNDEPIWDEEDNLMVWDNELDDMYEGVINLESEVLTEHAKKVDKIFYNPDASKARDSAFEFSASSVESCAIDSVGLEAMPNQLCLDFISFHPIIHKPKLLDMVVVNTRDGVNYRKQLCKATQWYYVQNFVSQPVGVSHDIVEHRHAGSGLELIKLWTIHEEHLITMWPLHEPVSTRPSFFGFAEDGQDASRNAFELFVQLVFDPGGHRMLRRIIVFLAHINSRTSFFKWERMMQYSYLVI